MALLNDPTIQRILDEVNKAASGGILGSAGSYLCHPTGNLPSYQSDCSQLSPTLPTISKQLIFDDDTPLFYPTANMLSTSGFKDFDHDIDLNSLQTALPMVTPSSFDIYGSNSTDMMSANYFGSYDNYQEIIAPTKKSTNNQRISKKTDLSTPSKPHETIYPDSGEFVKADFSQNHPSSNVSQSLTGLEFDVKKSTNLMEPNLNHRERLQTQLDTSQRNNIENVSMAHKKLDSTMDFEDTDMAAQIFHDPNPQIIQRKGSHTVSYKQNIIVRYLQPPPIPNAGPLVIKEIRSPQPPPLPPLVIKQRPTPPKSPPPLIIREKPPSLPSLAKPKVIKRQLPSEPAPPRTVIIERLPPLPPKPRDIIIERWLPYQVVNPKRKVIVETAPKPSNPQKKPKNIIITYEPVKAKIIRNYQNQTVVQQDPQEYLKRYHSELYESDKVIEKARALGVLEDLNLSTTEALNNQLNSIISDDDIQRVNQTTATNGLTYTDTMPTNECQIQNHVNTQPDFQTSPGSTSSRPTTSRDDLIHTDDISVEENVTPFYINPGENLQQTLDRLGIGQIDDTGNHSII